MSTRLSNSCWLLVFALQGCHLLENPAQVCESPQPNLIIEIISLQASSQCAQPDGAVGVRVLNGRGPYIFSLDGVRQRYEGTFEGVSAGEHLIAVKDASGCEGFLKVFIAPAAGVLQATAVTTNDDKCFSNSGSISIYAREGVPPYEYRLDSLPFRRDSIFRELDKGVYWIYVKDAANCEYQFTRRVYHGDTGTSYSRDVRPVLTSYCVFPSCHNGDVGNITNFTVFSNVKSFGFLLIRYAGTNHLPKAVPEGELQYIRCWIEDGSPFN